MTPDLWYGDKVQHVNGNVSSWRDSSYENIVVWDKDSEVAQVLGPLNGKKVSETGLTAIEGTSDGEVNHTVGIKQVLEPTAVLKVDIRTKRK